MRRLALLLVASTACGRYGFDAPPRDALVDDDADDALRADAAPACVESTHVLTTTGAQASAFVAAGSDLAAVWGDARSGNGDVYFARLDATGAKLGSDLRLEIDGAASGEPSIDRLDAGFAVAWAETASGPSVKLALVDDHGLAGAPQAARDSVAGGRAFGVFVLPHPQGHAVIFGDSRAAKQRIYASIADASGVKVGADIDLAGVGDAQLYRAIAHDGIYAIVYMDATSPIDVYLGLRTTAGAVIGADVIVQANFTGFLDADLTWTGDEYAVALSSGRAIQLHRFDAALAGLGVTDIATAEDAPVSPHVAWVGDGFGVAWEEGQGSPGSSTVARFTRTDVRGVAVGDTFASSGDQPQVLFPRVAAFGRVAVASWTDFRTGEVGYFLSCPR